MPRDPVDVHFKVVTPKRIRWGLAALTTLLAAVLCGIAYQETKSGLATLMVAMAAAAWPFFSALASLQDRAGPEEVEELAARLARGRRGPETGSGRSPKSAQGFQDLKVLPREDD